MERRHRNTGVAIIRHDRTPPRVQGFHHGFQQADATFPPARAVERQRKLGESRPVDLCKRIDECVEVGRATQPRGGRVVDRRPERPSTVSQELSQQLVPATEVVGHPGIGDADTSGDSANGDTGQAFFSEQIGRGDQDLRPRVFW